MRTSVVLIAQVESRQCDTVIIFKVLALAHFEVGRDGTFKIKGKHGFEIESGSYMLHRNNVTYSTADNSLTLKHGATYAGQDTLGEYHEHAFDVSAVKGKDLTAYTKLKFLDKQVAMTAFIRVYPAQEFALFRQHFYPSWDGMSVGDADRAVSAFPSVNVPKKSNMKFINPCWHMAGFFSIQAEWQSANVTLMCGGIKGGPFFIFDQVNVTSGHLGQTVAISSFTKHTAWTAEPRSEESQIWFGLPGLVDQLPENGYDISTIISYSDKGFYESVQKWGATLRKYTGKGLERRESDDTVNYLGYWTDNGAFYYYNTEENKNYEVLSLSRATDIQLSCFRIPC